jgi:DNA uptake protein ComE-like DNA-binding protein
MAKNDGLTDPRLGRRIIAEARLRRYEARVELAIKAALRIQKAKVMAALRSQYLTAAGPPDAFDLNSFDSAVTDEVLPVISNVFGDMTQKAMNFLALPPETRSQILGKIDVTSRTANLVEKVNGIGPAVAQKITDELTLGAARGESIDELTDRISGAFDFADNIAERVARTEIHGAAEATTFDSASAINNAGYGITKVWVATEDSVTRPDHADADGQEVDINDTFQVGDDELQYPGDPSGSAEQVINCRCSTTYSMSSDNQDMPDTIVDTENDGSLFEQSQSVAKDVVNETATAIEHPVENALANVATTEELSKEASAVSQSWDDLTAVTRYSQKASSALRDKLTEAGHGDFVEAIKSWQYGGTDQIHKELKMALGGGKVSTNAKEILDGIRSAPANAPQLLRGTFAPKGLKAVQASFENGSTFDLAPKSFSTEPTVGLLFAGQQQGEATGTKILYQLSSGSKGIPVQNLSESKSLFTEKEWISGGRYKVADTYTIPDPENEKKSVLVVQISQIAVH